jgi:elongator complex protein 1
LFPAYEFLRSFEKATDVYKQAGLWREALFCASQSPMAAERVDTLASALADSLYETKDYFNSATIHLDYRKDADVAARIFCKGYQFAEAMRIVGLLNRGDLLESIIDVGLAEGLANTTELLADCKGQLNAQVPRLRELRIKKEEDPLGFFEGASETDIADNISLAGTATSTSASLFTRYTSRTGTVNTQMTRQTSKNKRREERKRARGKKGSIYEEEYLVNSIERLVMRVKSVKDEVQRLTEGLLRRGMREQAIAVEKAYGEVVETIRCSVDEVFGSGSQEKVSVGENEPAIRMGGGDGVLQDSLEQIAKGRDRPVVERFEKMSLLGI